MPRADAHAVTDADSCASGRGNEELTGFGFSLLKLRRLDFAALHVHCSTKTPHQILAKSELVLVRDEARHLWIDELFAEELVRRHVGQGTQLLDGKL